MDSINKQALELASHLPRSLRDIQEFEGIAYNARKSQERATLNELLKLVTIYQQELDHAKKFATYDNVYKDSLPAKKEKVDLINHCYVELLKINRSS